jgi:flavin reductase (DIM6/NTAB) family NADH-FMN oxidoreductase RutF
LKDDVYFYDPAKGHGLPHDPLNAIVAPRPIGWISSRDPAGVLNLAPYSFFNAFNYRPPILGFSCIGKKHTLTNVERTKEFVWNLATRPLAEAMSLSSAAVPESVDEFEIARLTPIPSRMVSVPRVGESPVAMECRMSQIVRLTDVGGQAIDTWLVLGQVVGVHIATRLLKEGVFDTAAAEPVLRAGGIGTYFGISSDMRFEIARSPTGASSYATKGTGQ